MTASGARLILIMLSDPEKERLAARWFGEFLRETAVLVLVFVPLEWYLGRHNGKGVMLFCAVIMTILLLTVGIVIGFYGEGSVRERKENEEK